MLVLSPEFTKASILASAYLTELNLLCERDYGKSCFDRQIMCLDLDAYEASCKGANDATMDAAVGIADYQNNQLSSGRHLLVELRFGYKSTQNFDLSNMKRKISHSRDILCSEPINEDVVFIYDISIAPRARNFFNRLSIQDKQIKKWQIMDVNGFNNLIKDRASLPYVPENNLKEIEENLVKRYEYGGIEELDKMVKYWIDAMNVYNLKYKHSESNAVAEVILGFLESLIPLKDKFEEEYIVLLIEDVKNFLSTK